MEIKIKGNSRIFSLAIFGVVMVVSSYLIYFCNPLNAIIDKVTKITEGSITFRLWEKPSYQIYLKVYIFNVTNGNAFIEGKDEKLMFQEVGPFVFQETLENTNAKFYGNGSMSYIPKRSLRFIPEQSVGDPKDVVIFIPNIPLLGIASMLHQSTFMLNWAVASIVRVLDAQPILNLTVHDYFWGYNDSLVKMASSVLPNWIHFERFGILDRMFDEGNNTVTINVDPFKKTGSPLIDKQERGRLYSIQKWNGSPGLAHWGFRLPEHNETPAANTKCNMLEGAYDGTIFPPNITRDSVFRLYRKLFCRTVPIGFDHAGKTEGGFDGYWYRILDNFLDKYQDNPDNECYCTDKDFCLPKGLGDITPCYYGFPTAVSQPHFLNVDPVVFDKIGGLNPNEKDHGTSIVINPQIGLVLQGHSRMQINLVMRRTKQAKTKKFDDMYLPVFWSEMRVNDIPSDIHMLMTLLYKVLPAAQVVLVYLLAIVGAALIATAGLLVFLTAGTVVPRSPGLGVGYCAVKMIPIVRRETLISENKRTDYPWVE